MFGRDSLIPSAHLPFWFDYQLFKFVFNKTTTGAAEQRRRHRAYLNTCVRVLKLRTLFRMLAGTEDSFITREADLVSVVGRNLKQKKEKKNFSN